ncbi:MAG: hypothetical protein ACO3NW_05865 [Kiritimatiellia bacterium]
MRCSSGSKRRQLGWLTAGLLLFTSSCYRPPVRELTLHLPETLGKASELDAIRRYLLNEQDQLREGLVLYQEIQTDPESGSLMISYNREYLADMNLVHKIHSLGYQVRDLPGDPELRKRFLAQTNRP